MDGLSAGASIIAVVQMTQVVCKTLRDFYRDMRDARAQINQLYDAVVSLESILGEMGKIVERSGEDMINSALLTDPDGPLKQAQSDLATIKEKLQVRVSDGSRFEKVKLSMKQSAKRSFGWPFKKEEVMGIVTRLESHRKILMDDATVNTLSKQFEQSDILQDIRKDIMVAQDDRHRQRIIRWLSKGLPDPSAEHNILVKKHEESTGSWLVDGDDVKEWTTSPNSYLWVHGNAGAGKSILCSTVISHIQEKYKDEPNAVIVYWYFTFRDLTSQKVDNLLRMLVTNLCSKLTTLPKPILEAYSQANNGQLLPSSRSLMHMLEVLLDEYEDVYIVLDALDECPKAGLDQERQRDELLQRICELYCWEKESLHILTTSRTEPDIEETVMGLSDSPGTFKTVDVQGTHVQEDIKKYIRHKLGDRRFVKWTTSLKTEVETTLVSQANGMFRMVALQLDVLLKCNSVSSIRKALNGLPTTLDSFYDRILREIPEEDHHYASAALQWIAYSARPLSLRELAEAVIIHPRDDRCFDPDERFLDENRIYDILPAGLIQRIKQKAPDWGSIHFPGKKDLEPDDYSIGFVHFSVLEYLQSTQISPDLRSTFQIHQRKAQDLITESCLSYLIYIGDAEKALAAGLRRFCKRDIPILISNVIRDEDGNGNDGKLFAHLSIESSRKICGILDDLYVLSAYALGAWDHDATFREGTQNEYLDRLLLRFLSVSGNAWIFWCCFHFHDFIQPPQGHSMVSRNMRSSLAWQRALSSSVLTIVHPVVWVSWRGFGRTLELLLKDCHDLSGLSITTSIGPPLHAASYRGHLKIVKILISAHANVNAKGGRYGSPLIAASIRDDPNVVKTLLNAGADPEIELDPPFYPTALTAACHTGSAEIIKLLIASGANVNFRQKSSRYPSALHITVRRCLVEASAVLIDAGAKLDSRCDPESVYQHSLAVYRLKTEPPNARKGAANQRLANQRLTIRVSVTRLSATIQLLNEQYAKLGMSLTDDVPDMHIRDLFEREKNV